MTEDRKQKTEDRKQRTEDRRQRTEDRIRTSLKYKARISKFETSTNDINSKYETKGIRITGNQVVDISTAG